MHPFLEELLRVFAKVTVKIKSCTQILILLFMSTYVASMHTQSVSKELPPQLKVTQLQGPLIDKNLAAIVPQRNDNYQELFDSLGDRCYMSGQSSAWAASEHSNVITSYNGKTGSRWTDLFSRFPLLGLSQYSEALQSQEVQQATRPRKRAISSVDDLALLSDIEMARFKDNELILIGPSAQEGHGFRPDDWYVAFRAIATTEAPGVSIDPGPNPKLMQVRYFGGVQQTQMGNTLFEADRTLKILSTGYDNLTCGFWSSRPANIPSELDLISNEIGDGSVEMEGQHHWHRFWFEPSDDPIETEGLTARFPNHRLIVKDEPIPPNSPSSRSSREFAAGISGAFLKLGEMVRAFEDLQREAALVMLAKWMRDKQIPADDDWVKGTPSQASTPESTPSITVMRAKLVDQLYLRYGITGGVDFQKGNRYLGAAPVVQRLWTAAARARPATSSSTWLFSLDGQAYRAVLLKVTRPVSLRTSWTTWRRVIVKYVSQPPIYRSVIPVGRFVITNDTGAPLILQVSGPVSRTERIPAHTPSEVTVVPGSYRISIESQCGQKTESVNVKQGERRELRYWCEDNEKRITSGEGYFVVRNDTGQIVTFELAGPMNLTERVSPGSSVIKVVPGFYKLDITSRCGTSSDSVRIANGERHELRYICKEETRAPTSNDGVGFFVVSNNTGGPITVSVGGRSYRLAPGSSRIRLPPGHYTAKITTRCGVGTETLDVTDGSSFAGEYTCVRR